jgi:hypothetical protein
LHQRGEDILGVLDIGLQHAGAGVHVKLLEGLGDFAAPPEVQGAFQLRDDAQRAVQVRAFLIDVMGFDGGYGLLQSGDGAIVKHHDQTHWRGALDRVLAIGVGWVRHPLLFGLSASS